MDTIEKVEEYIQSLEGYFFSSLSAATTDMPSIHDAVNRIWVDISRYGPGMPAMPSMKISGLGDFQVPPPPPPPPPPMPSIGWVGRHPWTVSGIAVGLVGAGLLVGYRAIDSKRVNRYRLKAHTTERRQVVVVLGGDTPLALPLILDLEKKGYIIIASVSTSEAVGDLEHKGEGYVRALVLDPQDPATIPVFLRSLASNLSRRFPITAAGDPYASPSSHPYIHSIVSLLSISNSALSIHAPLEHISLHNTYLPYLSATHITPLQVIQALLPLLRTGPARTRDKGKKSIIVCLPAAAARVGLPFASMQAMAAASTLRGVEVLRREVNAAALTDKSESMKNIKVVIADVGAFDIGAPSSVLPSETVHKSMENWTASEKVTYGPAFAAVVHETPPPMSRWKAFSAFFKDGHRYGVARKPTDISVFVDNLVGVVSGGRHGSSLFGLGHSIGKIRNWIRGERFAMGSGANTYRLASFLPSLILDTLLNVPHVLISIRNNLLPVEPSVRPPTDLPPPVDLDATAGETHPEVEHDCSGNELSENNSEVDSESNVGDGFEKGWVRLKETQTEVSVSDGTSR